MLKVIPQVQNYDWGNVGMESAVAQLISGQQEISRSKAYAELWMGTHPSGPSRVQLADGSTKLLEAHVGRELPYLFKVLSVKKALSIQAHPDKKLAQILHREHPQIYKDPNHKPEIAIALTEFEAMCGFRPVEQLKAYLGAVPELRAVVGNSEAQLFLDSDPSDKAALRRLFSSYISATPSVVREASALLQQRLSSSERQAAVPGRELDLSATVLRLCDQYPGDVGVFAPFFLNCIRLTPGEGIFLPASEPHAYLKGDCLEAMACSDNVVRAGLTPKLIDEKTLCSMLTYNTGMVDVLQGAVTDTYTRMYTPNVDEFAVTWTQLVDCYI
jgi:mannose-6-phosphate isomerase